MTDWWRRCWKSQVRCYETTVKPGGEGEDGAAPILRPYTIARAARANAEASTPISPGEQTLTASMTLRYAFSADKSDAAK